MVKLSLSAAICCTLAFTASKAKAFEWDWYGKLELQALDVDKGLYRYADQGRQIEVPFSRLGLKAKHQLTDGLAIIAVYEWQVNGLDDANKDHRFSSRNTYIGVAGRYGELVFGKNDTRFKKSEGKIDLFNESLADIAQITPAQDRLENILSYQSPIIEGFHFSATYQTGASDETAGGYDWVLAYGDPALKKYPLYMAYGRTDELNTITAERLLAQLPLWKTDGAVLSAGVMVQHSEHLVRNTEGDSWLAQLSYQRNDWTYKWQWQKDDSQTRHAEKARLHSIGVDYQWRNNLTAYLLLSKLHFETDRDHAAALGMKFFF
ncbi:MAG: porin [Gammaproteobacteria bacterium]|nr:porin [Gammaproteobacteria bacterium]MBU2058763.1 porin [Gammaproteobacteria bacterium]MBU2177020.1 porin [Gammaproteobacteria bacterium]MBU2246467.1 porin [Gammaproteobacteria bacterium]MBU2343664.1 porin [Gammaproteobacteria bacterium]